MTTSRVIRGTKAKVFLYICAIVVITGLIACYNNTINQLEEVKSSNSACHQQQEHLSTQFQVLSDYKQKLEKDLKNEKAEHQQSKSNCEIKINEEKSKGQKMTNDALLKYNSLQQHFKLLESELEDFKEKSKGTQKKQLEEINSFQSKLNEVEEEMKKVQATKEKLKTQLAEIELTNIQLNKALQKTSNNESLKFYSEEYRILSDKYNALEAKCVGSLENITPSSANKPSEKAILYLPGFKLAENPSSSTKAVPKASLSRDVLNGAKPLLMPSVTPETAKKQANLKPPQGVVEPPENRENQNEQPQVQFEKKGEKGMDDLEKDNVAQEVFDGPLNNIEGLAFADDMKQNGIVDQKVNKKRDDQEYKDSQREEEGDDDLDDYGERQARIEDVAVRN